MIPHLDHIEEHINTNKDPLNDHGSSGTLCAIGSIQVFRFQI